jgi:DNA-binding transcriptional MerR regulator
MLAPAGADQKIGQVSERSGLPVKTIRFYCDEGLIRPSGRSEGRYRLFDEDVYEELALIRTLRAMEIPLAQVGQILEARRSGVCTCDSLKATISTKLSEIRSRIADLNGLSSELSGLLKTWESCGRQKARNS